MCICHGRLRYLRRAAPGRDLTFLPLQQPLRLHDDEAGTSGSDSESCRLAGDSESMVTAVTATLRVRVRVSLAVTARAAAGNLNLNQSRPTQAGNGQSEKNVPSSSQT